MKKNDFVQIKGLDLKELKGKAMAIKAELANLVMEKNINKLKDLKMLSKKRKDLAKVLTIMRQKQLLTELEAKLTTEQPKKGIS